MTENLLGVFGKRTAMAALAIAAVSTMYAYDKTTVVSTDPADGATVTRLSQIGVTLEGGEVYGYKLVSQAAKVYNEADEEITYVNYAAMPTGGVFKLKSAITDPGTYTIKFPEGCLYALNENMEKVEGTENDEFTLTYEVVDMSTVTVASLDPADGSTVTKLSQINAELEGGSSLYGYKIVSQAVKVYDEAGEEITYLNYATMQGGGIFKLKSAITTPGKYTISFPDGALYALDKKGQKVEGTDSYEFSLKYTVVDSPDIEFVSADPASGETVNSLSVIRTTWKGGDETVGYGFNDTPDFLNVVSAGEIVANATLSREGDEYLITLNNEITTNGDYTITLPDGALWALDAEGNPVYGNESLELTLSYKVDIENSVKGATADGTAVVVKGGIISAVGFENPSIAVYDLAGAQVLNVNAASAEASLSAGVYVVKVTDGANTAVARVVIR